MLSDELYEAYARSPEAQAIMSGAAFDNLEEEEATKDRLTEEVGDYLTRRGWRWVDNRLRTKLRVNGLKWCRNGRHIEEYWCFHHSPTARDGRTTSCREHATAKQRKNARPNENPYEWFGPFDGQYFNPF